MCLVDYLGFRLIATSLIPISSSSLISGSNDGGKTVHSDNEELNSLLAESGKRLGIKPHYCGGKILSTVCDLEGHIGEDGHFYLLDFARTFPPQTPDKS